MYHSNVWPPMPIEMLLADLVVATILSAYGSLPMEMPMETQMPMETETEMPMPMPMEMPPPPPP